MPDSFSFELRSLLTGLLQRDVSKRLGCRGRGALELKTHPFFRGIDWRVVYLQRLQPPLIPARGEVNAADAFDIGSFDDEDTKHIKLTEPDQELYRNFPVVVSERWQDEIAETIFDYINHEADKAEMKRKSKLKQAELGFYEDEKQSDCILHGYIKRLGGTFTATWLTRYVRLYPNRLELYSDSLNSNKQPELIFMDQIEEVCNDFVQIKNEQCIVIKLYNHTKYVLTNSDEIGLKEWHVSLKAAYKDSHDMLTTMAEKATKIYGTEIPLKHMGKRRQQLQNEMANAAIQSSSQNTTSNNSSFTHAINANLEQKIIQRELQASASSTSVTANKMMQNQQQQKLEDQQKQQESQHKKNTSKHTAIDKQSQAHRRRVHKHSHHAHHSHDHSNTRQHVQTHKSQSSIKLSSISVHQQSHSPLRQHLSAKVGGCHERHSHRHGHHTRSLSSRSATNSTTKQMHKQSRHSNEQQLGKSLPQTVPSSVGDELTSTQLANDIATNNAENQSAKQQLQATSSCSEQKSLKENKPCNDNGDKEEKDKEITVKIVVPTASSEQAPLTNDSRRASCELVKTTSTESVSSQSSALSATSSTDSSICSSSIESREHGNKNSRSKQDKNNNDSINILNDDDDESTSSNSLHSSPEISDSESLPSTSSHPENISSQSGENNLFKRLEAATSQQRARAKHSSKNKKIATSEASTTAFTESAIAETNESSTENPRQEMQPRRISRLAVASQMVASSLLSVQASATSIEEPVKPSLSLENVSEAAQEVLQDPSKRITSDNRKREQDLIAQYEKLNITNRTSSSSIED